MSIHTAIERLVQDHPVVLFMKGTRQAPQCGFSATVVQILDGHLGDYLTVDVLADPAMRQGIKDYSNWPTIPQLYVNQSFVGGCDIIREMAQLGELESLLVGGEPAAAEPPQVSISSEAEAAFRSFAEDSKELRVRLQISPQFQYELDFDEERSGDIVVSAGTMTLLFDRASARRADGLLIDFVEGPQGGGFRMENPNEPPRVRFVNPEELRAWIAGGKPIELLDIRSPIEREAGSIPGSYLLDDVGVQRLEALDRDTALVIYCRRGISSRGAAEHCIGMGFREVYSLDGGYIGWANGSSAQP